MCRDSENTSAGVRGGSLRARAIPWYFHVRAARRREGACRTISYLAGLLTAGAEAAIFNCSAGGNSRAPFAWGSQPNWLCAQTFRGRLLGRNERPIVKGRACWVAGVVVFVDLYRRAAVRWGLGGGNGLRTLQRRTRQARFSLPQRTARRQDDERLKWPCSLRSASVVCVDRRLFSGWWWCCCCSRRLRFLGCTAKKRVLLRSPRLMQVLSV